MYPPRQSRRTHERKNTFLGKALSVETAYGFGKQRDTADLRGLASVVPRSPRDHSSNPCEPIEL